MAIAVQSFFAWFAPSFLAKREHAIDDCVLLFKAYTSAHKECLDIFLDYRAHYLRAW
jgi:hypothetical protein